MTVQKNGEHDTPEIREYEVAVIGAGPGGYETAIRLNQKGIRTVLFEKEKMGGECLNWGCIPTKAMVKSAELYNELGHLGEYGIEISNATLDFERMMKRKSDVVAKLTGGLDHIFKKRKIPVIGEEVVSVRLKSEKDESSELYELETGNGSIYTAQYVITATGSKPMELPFLKFDGEYLLSSRDLLDLQSLPEHLSIIGGGTIGCEFASIFANLGVKVEIVEMLPTLLSLEDKEISRKLTTAFKKKGIKVHTNTKVESAKIEDGKVMLDTDKGKSIITDKVLISTGRVPSCKIDFGSLTVRQDKEKVIINDLMETGQQNIFAIGDVTGMLMLAHTASKQGLLVADIIENRLKKSSNSEHKLTYHNIPRCTFTEPELASVGLTEEQAQDTDREISVGKFNYMGNGKALATGCKDGYIKVISDKESKKMLGMHIIGSAATELIALGSVMINTGLTTDDLHKVVYAHPTISEVVMEAIEDLDGTAIHKI